jgi:hypothetical protein
MTNILNLILIKKLFIFTYKKYCFLIRYRINYESNYKTMQTRMNSNEHVFF